MIFASKSKIPGWFVGLVVLVTGLLTFWTMIQRNDGQLWATEAASYPQRVTQVFSPAAAVTRPGSFQQVAQPPGPALPVASNRPVPAIQAGAPSPHGDRGACTLCHMVVDRLGSVIPIIPALASLPHQYRGVCTNCHQVSGAASGRPSSNPFAAAAALAPGGAGSWGLAAAPADQPLQAAQAPGGAGTWYPAAAIQGQPLQVAPAEGAWLGMELVPITPLIQRQYGLPAGSSGLAIAEAEAQAAAAGAQPGDVLIAVNGLPVRDLGSLQQATGGLTLTGAALDLLRQGQLVRVVVGQGLPPAGGAAPLQPVGALPGYGPVNAAGQPLYQGAAAPPNLYPNAGGGYPAQP